MNKEKYVELFERMNMTMDCILTDIDNNESEGFIRIKFEELIENAQKGIEMLSN